MAAVAHASTVTGADFCRLEHGRHQRHGVRVPGLERGELRRIYARKGLSGELFERVVEKVTSDADLRVAQIVAEEHRPSPVSRRTVLRTSVTVELAALVGVARSPTRAGSRWRVGALSALAGYAVGVLPELSSAP